MRLCACKFVCVCVCARAEVTVQCFSEPGSQKAFVQCMSSLETLRGSTSEVNIYSVPI